MPKVLNDSVTFGYDISRWQGVPKGDQVIRHAKKLKINLGFIITKASEGSFIDPRLIENWRWLDGLPLLRGTYHFYNPNYNPVTQARAYYNFVQEAAQDTNSDMGDFPPIMDAEQRPMVAKDLKQFLDETERLWGKKPWIYTGGAWADMGGVSWAKNYRLWLAQYPRSDFHESQWDTIPNSDAWVGFARDWGGRQPDIWQWTEKGPGNDAGFDSSGLDVDIFKGTKSELAALLGAVEPKESVEAGEKEPEIPETPPVTQPKKKGLPKLSNNPTILVTVTSFPLNIRTEPAVRSNNIVGYLSSGDIVPYFGYEIEDDGDVWVKIGHNQWVAQSYNGFTYGVLRDSV